MPSNDLLEGEEGSWWLSIPPGWSEVSDPDCATIVSEGELGTLQISAAFAPGDVTDADLRDFAQEHIDAGAPTADVVAGDFRGFEIAYDDGEAYWRQWYLRAGSQILFVTYGCPLDAVGVDDAALESALGTLGAVGAH
ncbi:hypothetical protein [Engelhardtia mirabilis]|uniref:hypothetical protein n=1 Tax=Engelhardtia mirabilis TaxID=2528011 RepID=UPI00119D0A54